MSTLHITDLQLFNLLKHKLGEKEAEAVTNYVKQEVENGNKKVTEIVNKDIAHLRDHLDDRFSANENKMDFKIEQLRGDIYKVIFWSSLVQILTVVGGIIALYKIFKT
jgi:hypothetical protein